MRALESTQHKQRCGRSEKPLSKEQACSPQPGKAWATETGTNEKQQKINLVVTVAQLCESKIHRIRWFKRVIYTVCDLHLNRAV